MATTDDGHDTRVAFRYTSIAAIAVLVLFILYFMFGGRHVQQAATEQHTNPPAVEQAKPETPPATPAAPPPATP